MATQLQDFNYSQQMSYQQPLPALLGSKYCSPHPTTFYVQDGKNCVRHGLPVTVLDSQGELAFTQESNAKTMKISRSMKTPEGKTVCSFLGKGFWQRTCVISPGAEVSDSNAIASVARKSWSGRYGVEVKLAGSSKDDFIVRSTKKWAGFFGLMTWDIIFQGQIIGQVARVRSKDESFLQQGAYKVMLNPGVDHAFMVCVIILLDIWRQQDNSLAGTSAATNGSTAAAAAAASY